MSCGLKISVYSSETYAENQRYRKKYNTIFHTSSKKISTNESNQLIIEMNNEKNEIEGISLFKNEISPIKIPTMYGEEEQTITIDYHAIENNFVKEYVRCEGTFPYLNMQESGGKWIDTGLSKGYPGMGT